MVDKEQIPLFPLNTVLFPGGAVPLRIFEPRYLDMVSHCLKNEKGFGVCLISEGREVGNAARTFEVGTLVYISYWNKLPDGLLGITVRGDQRFRIISQEVRPNQLTVAEVEYMPREPENHVPSNHLPMVDLLRKIMDQMDYPYANLPRNYEDAAWVGYRLAELLPIPLTQKQYFLQLDDPLQRLERLSTVLSNLDLEV